MEIIEKLEYCPKCGSRHFEKESRKSRRCDNCGFEYFMNASSANAAFIVNERGELLVTRRNREPAKGMLDLPGGFADAGETAEEGVVREVMEETDLPSPRPNTFSVCPMSTTMAMSTSPRSTSSSVARSMTSLRFKPPTMPPNVCGSVPKTSTPSSSVCALCVGRS